MDDLQSDLKRFFKRVEKSDSCWNWTGTKAGRGYGHFFFRGKMRYAHRVSMEVLKSEKPPSDKVVMHICDNIACVNPDHLLIGTQTDNMRDAAAKGRTRRVGDWRGEKNPKSKLATSQFQEIISLLEDGLTRKEVAARFSITTVRVGQIWRSKPAKQESMP
jgi:hypothetical protein